MLLLLGAQKRIFRLEVRDRDQDGGVCADPCSSLPQELTGSYLIT